MKNLPEFVADVYTAQAMNDLTNAEVAAAMAAILVATCHWTRVDPMDLVRQAKFEVARQLTALGVPA